MTSPLRAVVCAAIVLSFVSSVAEAGQVKATLRRGKLTVSGNCAENQLAVFPVPTNPQSLIVDSLAVFDGVTSLGVFPLAAIDKVVIKAKGRADHVSVAMVDYIDLCITTGCNSDVVFVTGYIGDLEIVTGDRHDTVCVTSAYIEGKTTIKTGCGKDSVLIGGFCFECEDEGEGQSVDLSPANGLPLFGVQFCDDVNIAMGDGRDELIVYEAYFGCEQDEEPMSAVAELMDLSASTFADIFGIKVRLNGGCGKDCAAFFNSNIALEDYAKSFEEDCFP